MVWALLLSFLIIGSQFLLDHLLTYVHLFFPDTESDLGYFVFYPPLNSVFWFSDEVFVRFAHAAECSDVQANGSLKFLFLAVGCLELSCCLKSCSMILEDNHVFPARFAWRSSDGLWLRSSLFDEVCSRELRRWQVCIATLAHQVSSVLCGHSLSLGPSSSLVMWPSRICLVNVHTPCPLIRRTRTRDEGLYCILWEIEHTVLRNWVCLKRGGVQGESL